MKPRNARELARPVEKAWACEMGHETVSLHPGIVSEVAKSNGTMLSVGDDKETPSRRSFIVSW